MRGSINKITINTIDEEIIIDSYNDYIYWMRHSRIRKGYVIRCAMHDIFVADKSIKSIVVEYDEEY